MFNVIGKTANSYVNEASNFILKSIEVDSLIILAVTQVI